MNKLEVRNVSKTFEDKKVLEDISIHLNKGELVSLLGVSGSGKTTLFNVISGLLRPDNGSVRLDGADITGEPGHISYMLQLSGGMRQRAALLRTYMFSQNVALLDEPFSALDTITKSAIHDWYLDVMEQIQLSTLFITHDIDEAILLSDRIYLLTGNPGRITDEIVIDSSKPRHRDFTLTYEFLEYKKKILERLG